MELLRNKIIRGYQTGSAELLQYALSRLNACVRLSGPMFMIVRYYEERARMMRWIRHFGLRKARSRNEELLVPVSVDIELALVRQAGQDRCENGDAAALGSMYLLGKGQTSA